MCTATLGIPIDLTKVATTARNAEFNPSRFPAVIMRLREPKTTILLFGSGKMVLTGAKTEYDARIAQRKLTRILQVLGYLFVYMH